MQREDFKKWAEHGCRQYSDDPWFFIRELAQNSRDAFARMIKAGARRSSSGEEIFEFEDNGTGMTLDHARSYLFRLYASSKDDDRRSAGKYGIGFWSVLRFDPSHILIESRTQQESWGIIIDDNFNLTKVRCGLSHQGTRITLSREAACGSEREFQEAARKALKRYCRYLRRNNRKSNKLPVIFQGKNLTRSIRLPGPLSLSFRDGRVEGAVGFADTPSVRLYARGLPVWKGLILDELSHTEDRSIGRSEMAQGLNPVFLLNGNNLNVIMSRRAVIDDKELSNVRKSAHGAMSRLVQMHMERAFPQSRLQKLLDAGRKGWDSLLRLPPAYIILAVLIALLGVVAANFLPGLGNFLPGLKRGQAPQDVSVLPSTYSGAVVEDLTAAGRANVNLTYEPPVEAWFKILTADYYDSKSGFIFVKESGALKPSPPFACKNECLSVRFRIDRGGQTTLPAPSGYLLEPDSLRYNGSPLTGIRQSPGGDTIVVLPGVGGLLEYTCGPSPQAERIDDAYQKRLTLLPENMSMPRDIQKVIARASVKSTDARLFTALSLTHMLVSYDDSQQTAEIYRGLKEGGEWLPFVINAEKGDCDVLNGLNALLLRKMGVPSRLAIGLLGRSGRAISELHAWTEYYDGQWRTVDATPIEEAAPLVDARPPDTAHSRPGNIRTDSGPVPSRINLVEPAEGDESDIALAKRALIHPVRAKEPPPGLTTRSRDLTTFILILFSILSAALAIVLSVFLVMQRRQWEHMRGVKDPRLAEYLLARMVNSAAVHPRMWRHARGLWLHRILPTLDGPRISIVEASKLAHKRKLFLGSQSCPLAMDAASAGSVILDRDNRAFGPFLARLSGVVDLDAMEKIKPQSLKSESDPFAHLLGTVNRMLERSGPGGIRCLHSPGLSSVDSRDIDLKTLSLPRDCEWPKRFIAVNPNGVFVREYCALFERNPQLAAFKLIQKLTRDSLFLSEDSEKIRRVSSRILVEEAS